MTSSTNAAALRGRQCVTFMLVANIALFLFHVYESTTAGFAAD